MTSVHMLEAVLLVKVTLGFLVPLVFKNILYHSLSMRDIAKQDVVIWAC